MSRGIKNDLFVPCVNPFEGPVHILKGGCVEGRRQRPSSFLKSWSVWMYAWLYVTVFCGPTLSRHLSCKSVWGFPPSFSSCSAFTRINTASFKRMYTSDRGDPLASKPPIFQAPHCPQSVYCAKDHLPVSLVLDPPSHLFVHLQSDSFDDLVCNLFNRSL